MAKLIKERYLGALLGASIGDALGWPNEQNSNNIKKNTIIKGQFIDWKRKTGGRYWPSEETICAGEYSDDTQLLIATLRSLLKGNQWSRYFRQAELPAWLVYERGGGGATKRAANCWLKDYSPWDSKYNSDKNISDYFMAGGNGVVMRIMPHVFGNENNADIIMKQVLLNGMYTHGHPRALVGALLYACALQFLFTLDVTLEYGRLIQYLLDNKNTWGKLPEVNHIDAWLECSSIHAKINYVELWDSVIEETIEYLITAKKGLELGILDVGNDTLEKLGCFDKEKNGAGNVTTVISIYLFSKYASSPMSALLETVNLKNSDTDTIASLTGGLVGAIHGEQWMPVEYRILQDYEVFDILLSKFLNGQDDIVTNAKNYKLLSKNLATSLKVGDSIEVLPFGNIKLIDVRKEKAFAKDMYADTYICKTSYNQTLFIKKVGKMKDVINISEQNVELPIENQGINVNFNRTVLMQLHHIFIKADNASDFLNIIGSIIELIEKGVELKKCDMDSLREQWGKYKITKKQLESAYKLLKNEVI